MAQQSSAHVYQFVYDASTHSYVPGPSATTVNVGGVYYASASEYVPPPANQVYSAQATPQVAYLQPQTHQSQYEQKQPAADADQWKAAFEYAAQRVHKLAAKPSQEELLQLYGWYKQATEGDCRSAKPSFVDFKAKAKWDAWKACQGKDYYQACASYIGVVQKLCTRNGQAY